VGAADLLGTPEIFIEAKRVERLNFRDAMAQAERNIIQTHAPEVPVVITRRSRELIEDSLVVMRLKDWELMYGAYLKATAHMRDDALPKQD
jgi:PHD/YefM family antitoxin component YafN of YafNO toxin-antitoxin module